MGHPTSIVGHLECEPGNAATLAHIAESVDKFVGAYPRSGGYDVQASVCAILNGGTQEQIATAFKLLKKWSFEPQGGW